MKFNVMRTLSFLLVCVMLIGLFVGCGNNEADTPTDVESTQSVASTIAPVIVDVDKDDPYTISKDANGKDIVILTPNADGSITMTVAENTTLEAFLGCVVAKDGYVVKVTDVSGKEVTDKKALIAKDMVFEVVNEQSSESEIKLIINVVTQDVIQETVEEQEEINNNTNSVVSAPVNNETSNNQPSNPGDSTAKETIKLASIWSNAYEADDASGKIWQSTFSSMEKNQGMQTQIINLHGDTAADSVVKEVMAGKSEVDVYETPAYIARCIARKGCLANLKTCSTLKMANFDNAGTQSMTFGNNLYGVAIDFKATKMMGILYNKDLIQKHAPTYDVEKLYKEKKWTFEIFQALAKACTKDLNGDNRPDVHGLTSNTNVIGMALTANAGGTALMSNGRVVATMCSDAGITALEFMKKLYNTDKSWKYFGSIKDSVNYFANGQSAMFASWMSYYTDIVPKANFKVGFVLMPMGPDQKNYISGQYDAQFYIVPKTKKDRLDVIGNWLNGVAGASGKLITNELRNLAINGFDKNTQDIYKWGVSNATPEFSSGLFSQDVSSQVDSSVTAASKSPAKVMTSIKSKAQNELDDFYAPLY